MAYQVAVILSTSLCIKAGLGDPIWEIGSQKPIKELGAAPVLAVRSLTRRPTTQL